jgi:hypothetical protein
MMSSESPGFASPRVVTSGAFPFVSILTTADPIFLTTWAKEADKVSDAELAGAGVASV